jgi:transposase-like protein
VRAGKPQKQTADDLGIHPVTLSKWIKRDDIDRGARPGVPSSESTELRAARRRIQELATVRQAATFLGRTNHAQKDLPGDRPTRRCRGIRGPLLPHSRCSTPELLQTQAKTNHCHPAAPVVVDRTDSRDPRRLPWHLRISPLPRRADSGNGHHGLPADSVGPDDSRRNLWPTRAGASQTAPWRGHRRRSCLSSRPQRTRQYRLGDAHK